MEFESVKCSTTEFRNFFIKYTMISYVLSYFDLERVLKMIQFGNICYSNTLFYDINNFLVKEF